MMKMQCLLVLESGGEPVKDRWPKLVVVHRAACSRCRAMHWLFFVVQENLAGSAEE